MNLEFKYDGINTFLTKDNKYLIIFTKECYYNVYDIEQDKWLLEKSIELKCDPLFEMLHDDSDFEDTF